MKNLFMLFIFGVCSTASSIASAQQYTCSDRENLRSILLTLDRNCGAESFCRAKGRIGNTPAEAVSACMSTGWNQRDCEEDVTCSGEIGLCRAKGRIGDTARQAVSACMSTGWNQRDCEEDVTCSGGIGLCRAKGRIGETAQQAISACMSTGWNQRDCEEDVSCQ